MRSRSCQFGGEAGQTIIRPQQILRGREARKTMTDRLVGFERKVGEDDRGRMVDQREVYIVARDRSGTHKIVTTHFLAEVSERRVAYSNLQMLLSEAFEEQDTAIKTK